MFKAGRARDARVGLSSSKAVIAVENARYGEIAARLPRDFISGIATSCCSQLSRKAMVLCSAPVARSLGNPNSRRSQYYDSSASLPVPADITQDLWEQFFDPLGGHLEGREPRGIPTRKVIQ